MPQYPTPGAGNYYTFRRQVPIGPGERLGFLQGRGYYAQHIPNQPLYNQNPGGDVGAPVVPPPTAGTHSAGASIPRPGMSGPPTGYPGYPGGTPTPGAGIGGPAMPEDGPFEPGGPQGIVAWGQYRNHQPVTDIQRGVGVNPVMQMLQQRAGAGAIDPSLFQQAAAPDIDPRAAYAAIIAALMRRLQGG